MPPLLVVLFHRSLFHMMNNDAFAPLPQARVLSPMEHCRLAFYRCTVLSCRSCLFGMVLSASCCVEVRESWYRSKERSVRSSTPCVNALISGLLMLQEQIKERAVVGLNPLLKMSSMEPLIMQWYINS